jgi:hypothetical protein
MKAKLILENGREIEVKVKTEDFKKAQPKKTGYERVGKNEKYYVSDNSKKDGYTDFIEDADVMDDNSYVNADYYNNPTLAENNTRADRLMRQLRRFAVEHSKKELDWNNNEQDKYYIYYNYCDNKLECDGYVNARDFGQIYFDTLDACEEAIKEFKNELIWYFTEYRDRI